MEVVMAKTKKSSVSKVVDSVKGFATDTRLLVGAIVALAGAITAIYVLFSSMGSKAKSRAGKRDVKAH
jgi:hypothetical protein